MMRLSHLLASVEFAWDGSILGQGYICVVEQYLILRPACASNCHHKCTSPVYAPPPSRVGGRYFFCRTVLLQERGLGGGGTIRGRDLSISTRSASALHAFARVGWRAAAQQDEMRLALRKLEEEIRAKERAIVTLADHAAGVDAVNDAPQPSLSPMLPSPMCSPPFLGALPPPPLLVSLPLPPPNATVCDPPHLFPDGRRLGGRRDEEIHAMMVGYGIREMSHGGGHLSADHKCRLSSTIMLRWRAFPTWRHPAG